MKSKSIIILVAFLLVSNLGVTLSSAVAEPGASGQAAAPDFGPNVFVFDPSMSNIQKRIDAIFNQQGRSQFGSNRYAYLFKPGKYNLDVEVGFYMQVLGLGRSPDDVAITGAVRSLSLIHI